MTEYQEYKEKLAELSHSFSFYSSRNKTTAVMPKSVSQRQILHWLTACYASFLSEKVTFALAEKTKEFMT